MSVITDESKITFGNVVKINEELEFENKFDLMSMEHHVFSAPKKAMICLIYSNVYSI